MHAVHIVLRELEERWSSSLPFLNDGCAHVCGYARTSSAAGSPEKVVAAGAGVLHTFPWPPVAEGPASDALASDAPIELTNCYLVHIITPFFAPPFQKGCQNRDLRSILHPSTGESQMLLGANHVSDPGYPKKGVTFSISLLCMIGVSGLDWCPAREPWQGAGQLRVPCLPPRAAQQGSGILHAVDHTLARGCCPALHTAWLRHNCSRMSV